MVVKRKSVDQYNDEEKLAIKAACAYVDMEAWRTLMYDIGKFGVTDNGNDSYYVYAREFVYTVEKRTSKSGKSILYRVRDNQRRRNRFDNWETIMLTDISP